MSFPISGKITRVSNGTIELTPDNQFDLSKLDIGQAIRVEDGEEAEEKASRKSKKK